MDICFKALQQETTGGMVAAAATPASHTSSSLRIATGLAYALGDFAWPGTWFLMSAARRAGRDAEVLDVAA